MPQDPVNASRRAAEIEPKALLAWPARDRVLIDGWVLRATDGFTHRGNSVATFAFAGTDLAQAIDRVEREYVVRNLPAMSQVATHVEPPALAEALLMRGYRMISPTFVCATTPARVLSCLTGSDAVSIDAAPSPAFAELVKLGARAADDGSERSAALVGDSRERLDILHRIDVPLACITGFENGKAVSCGMGVNVDGKVGVNLMRTDVAHRRRGHAQRVLSALARWAEEQGADELYLGVEMANTPAVTLYERAGFERVYSYRYYAKGRDS